jgi:hypothetical protein
MFNLPSLISGFVLAAAPAGAAPGDYFIAGNMQYLQALTGCLEYSTEGKFMAFNQGISCLELYAKYAGGGDAPQAPASKGHQ